MVTKLRGFRKKAHATGRTPAPGPLQAFGLAERPFRESRHGFLLTRSESVGGALERLQSHCREGGEILLATAGIADIQHSLCPLLDKALEEDFLVVNIRADLLMSAEEVLERIAGAVGALDGVPCAPDSMIRSLRLFLASQDSLKGLVVQVEDAHELGADVLEALVELAADPAAADIMRLLLWGEFYLWDSLSYLLEGRDLPGRHVEVPAFTREDIGDYLEYCLVEAGFRQDFPFSEAQIERIYQESQSVPHLIDELADDELELAAAAGRRRRPWPLPMPHALAVTGLLAALAVIYPATESAGNAGGAAVASRPAGEAAARTVVLPIQTLAAATTGAAPAAAAAVPAGPAETPADVAPATAAGIKASPAAGPGATAPAANEAATAVRVTIPGRENSLAAAPSPARSSTLAKASEAAPAARQPAAQAPAVRQSAADTLSALERSQERLRSLPEDHYFLQMMGSHSEKSAREFISGTGLGGQLYYFESEYQGRPWYVVVYGSFASRQQAVSALENLPAELRRNSPWVRSGGEIQAAMAKR